MGKKPARRLPVGAVLAVLSLLTAHGATQTPTIRSMTELVEVNVVVRDDEGRPVLGLQKEDFEVFDNGERQTISLLVQERDESLRRPVATNVFTNRMPVAEGRTGYAVILLDWLNTAWTDQAQARVQVIQMLQQIRLDDKVALFVLDRGLRTVHDFTSDTAELVARLAPLKGRPPRHAEDQALSIWDASLRAFETDLFAPPSSAERPSAFQSLDEKIHSIDLRVRDTLAAFEHLADHLAGAPGRKSLIWVSAGFPLVVDSTVVRGASVAERTYTEEIERVIRRLNDADVAVYGVDARGLSLGSRGYVGTLQTFARRTGGYAFHNRNDLSSGIRVGLDDLRASYTLGYYPPKVLERGFRRIRVQIRRPDIVARYRTGYYAGIPSTIDSRNSVALAATALRSPVDASAIPVSVRTLRKQSTLELTIEVDSASLALRKDGNRWKVKIDLAARFTSDNGTETAPLWSRTVEIDLSESGYEEAIRDGRVSIHGEVDIPPNSTKFRLLVRDAQMESIGTVTIPLQQIAGQ